MTTGGTAARMLALLGVALLPLSCGDGAGSERTGAPGQRITLYTCLSDETVQPLVEGFEQANPDVSVDLFRAPTGELNARIAGDARSGGLRADVIWACDPLTMQGYVEQGLISGWTPRHTSAIPAEFRTEDYVGGHVLYMLAVHRDDAPAPRTWSDLTEQRYAGAVAIPDPAFAASALGALGSLAHTDGYGVDYFASLEDNGAVQVSSPTDVATGVAQGVYEAGMTIANTAYALQQDGSPIGVVWPEPGAVAVHGPIALAEGSASATAARRFISYAVGDEGQRIVGRSGSYPTREDVPGPPLPAGAPIVFPDWSSISADQERLLDEYAQIFGG